LTLTHEKITSAVHSLVDKYSITKASYFGSYANGTATETSDLDVLVEFENSSGALKRIINIKHDLEDMLRIEVDVIRTPIPEDSILIIDKEVSIYER
jgi:predicted nucleotidyltransferase